MSSVAMYVTIFTGILLFLSAAGVEGTATSSLLGALGLTDNDSGFENFHSSSFFTIVTGFIAAATGLGIILGLFVSVSPVYILISGFTIFLIGWLVNDMISVYQVLSTVGTEFAFIALAMKILFGFLIAGFLISIIEWWRNG